MDRAAAEAKIRSVFGQYHAAFPVGSPAASPQVAGKVYELFILTEVLKYLRKHQYRLRFSAPGSAAAFKSSHGFLKQSDPHFQVFKDRQHLFDVFVDVEFTTLGARHLRGATGDLGCYHEIDVGVYNAGQDRVRPSHDTVALAVECKAVTRIQKHVIRGMLGLRRELSLLAPPDQSILTTESAHMNTTVPADPASEVWLCTTDRRVACYGLSPESFGVSCRHEEP